MLGNYFRCGTEQEVDKEFLRRISKGESQTASIRNDWEQGIEDRTGSNASAKFDRQAKAV
jgi:hypothetical protein